jgi:DNA-binding transcriptional LysR family regulator
MDIRKLEAFCKVFELRSFSKAGQELFLSQPTISSHISHLEDELGVLLFDRLGKRTVPTQPADLLYRTAKELFQSLDDVQSEIHMLRDKVVGELQIGGSTIPANLILPRLISGFMRMHPGVTFSVDVSDTLEILKRVHNGDLSLGLVGSKPDLPGLASSLLMEDDMVVVASPALAESLDGENGTPLESVLSLPWIMREKGSGTRKSLEDALDACGGLRNLNVVSHVGSTTAVIECVLAGVGVSATSQLAVQRYVESGDLVLLDVPELRKRRRFYLTYLSERKLYPAMRAFLAYVENARETLPQQLMPGRKTSSGSASIRLVEANSA